MGKLVVVDDEYGELKAALGSFGDVVEEQGTEYLRILAWICDSAITEGGAARNLKSFAIIARNLMGKTKELTDFMQTSCDALVTSIDQADEYLY